MGFARAQPILRTTTPGLFDLWLGDALSEGITGFRVIHVRAFWPDKRAASNGSLRHRPGHEPIKVRTNSWPVFDGGDFLATQALIGTDFRMAAYARELHRSPTEWTHARLQIVL